MTLCGIWSQQKIAPPFFVNNPLQPARETLMQQPFDELYQISAAYQQSCVLAAAAELDCFTVVLRHDNRLTAGALAGKLAADPRGTTVLLDALTAMGYLSKSSPGESAVYSVAEKFKDLLDSRHPSTFIPILRHMGCVQRSWVQLAWAVKDGKPPVRPPSILGKEEDDISFILGMNSIARTLVDGVMHNLQQAGVLSFGKEDPDILDIGGASGTYTLAFLRVLPKARAAIFDLPVGIAAARNRFTGTEFESRVRLVTGDFYKDDLPQGFDFAWISAIIHQHGRAESRELYRKAFKALNPGGKAGVRDFIMSADRTAPKAGAFFGVNMLVATRSGMVYTLEEVKEDLEAAGFVNVTLAVPAETMAAVVVGQKPL